MPQVKLNETDFFRFNAPFRQWLFDAKGKQIGDFSTDEARSIFKKEFIVEWNDNKLPSMAKLCRVWARLFTQFF